jgi:hypothetical protein
MDEFDHCEYIALLNPKAIDTTRQIIDNLSRQDITPAITLKLSRCSQGASTLARVKYADMQELRVTLVNMLIDSQHIFSTLTIVQFIEFAELAVAEVCDPKACKWCRGVKWFPEMDDDGHDTGRRIICGGCFGEGLHIWHDKDRIERLKLSEKIWKNKYMYIYNDVLLRVLGWDREVKYAMKDLELN